MKIYLAGPMTGRPEHNAPAFNAAAAKLRAQQHQVFNPAENEVHDPPKPLAFYLKTDLPEVCLADAVYVLPGWKRSIGALCETFVATMCHIPVVTCRNGAYITLHDVLIAALRLVFDRKDTP